MATIHERNIPKFPQGLRVVETKTDADPRELTRVIKELGIVRDYDTAIFVMGGAGNWSDPHKVESIISGALVIVGKQRQLLIGDGGTYSGIMQVTGQAREILLNEGHDCLLVGVSPKEHVRYPGWDGINQEGIEVFNPEPNHTHLVVVNSIQQISQWGTWGNETNVMYRLFRLFAKGKESVGLVVNGGGITIDEVVKNLEQGRNLVVLKGSDRVADAIASIVEGNAVADPEIRKLRGKLLRKYHDKIARYMHQLKVFDINAEGATAESLAQVLISNLTDS